MRAFTPSMLIAPSVPAVIVVVGLSAIFLDSETIPDAAIVGLLAVGVMWVRWRTRRWRRRSEEARPPAGVLEAMGRWPLVQRLLPDERARLERDVAWFLLEHRITGVDVEVDDTLRATVACGAALLSLRLPHHEWDPLREVLLYSDTFDDDDFSPHDEGEFQGQFHEQGSILFAAPELIAGWEQEDGFNVSLHEFAHQVDYLAGGVDGTPRMDRARQWGQYVHDQIQRPDQNPDLRAVVDEYAWTDEGEFFACMTEVFFELPDVLHDVAPDLYGFLADVWAQDPVARISDDERMTISDFVEHRPRDVHGWMPG